MQADLLQRITINPDICHGKPTVRNMRYPVSLILDFDVGILFMFVLGVFDHFSTPLFVSNESVLAMLLSFYGS